MSFDMQYRPQMALQTADEKQMGLFLHLSQLGNFLLFPLGTVATVVLWQMNKDKIPALDAHGKMIVNWMISSIIYACISVVLIFVFFLGLIPLFGLAIAGIAFPIIGALKANNTGELWEYPLTIKFLK